MFLSIFSDELKVDITQGLPIIKSRGLNYVDLRGWIYGSHFEGLSVDQSVDNIDMSRRTTEVILNGWPSGRHVAQGIEREVAL